MEEKTDEENKKLCSGCGAECCKYMSIEIDPPEELEDFEDIRWYAAHKNVRVYVDEDNEWHVEFATPCKYLDENNHCSIYSKRPNICREYDQDECTFHNEYEEKYNFKDIDEVEKYIEEVFNQGKHELPEEDEEGEDDEDADVEDDEDVPEEGEDSPDEDDIEGEEDQPEEDSEDNVEKNGEQSNEEDSEVSNESESEREDDTDDLDEIGSGDKGESTQDHSSRGI